MPWAFVSLWLLACTLEAASQCAFGLETTCLHAMRPQCCHCPYPGVCCTHKCDACKCPLHGAAPQVHTLLVQALTKITSARTPALRSSDATSTATDKGSAIPEQAAIQAEIRQLQVETARQRAEIRTQPAMAVPDSQLVKMRSPGLMPH